MMVRPLSSARFLYQWLTFSARLVSSRRFFATSGILYSKQFTNTRSLVCTADGLATRINTDEWALDTAFNDARHAKKNSFVRDEHDPHVCEAPPRQTFREKLRSSVAGILKYRPHLNVAPLASLVIGEYTSGRVLCMDYMVYFQLGGAAHFETLCGQIRALALKNGHPRHYRYEEVRRLNYDQMVLCDEELQQMMILKEFEPVKDFAVPGALYRGRLLQRGKTLPRHCRKPEEISHIFDRITVELVDIGVVGDVHVSKIMPSPDAVTNLESVATIIGRTEGNGVTYDDDPYLESIDRTAEWMFMECCRYVQNAQFKPVFVHTDAEHLASEYALAFLRGTSVRRADGAIKFEMPENVENVPEHVVKLISKNLSFHTAVDWIID